MTTAIALPERRPVFPAGWRSGDLAGFMSRGEGFDPPARYPFPVRDVSGPPPIPPRSVATACPDREPSRRVVVVVSAPRTARLVVVVLA